MDFIHEIPRLLDGLPVDTRVHFVVGILGLGAIGTSARFLQKFHADQFQSYDERIRYFLQREDDKDARCFRERVEFMESIERKLGTLEQAIDRLSSKE